MIKDDIDVMLAISLHAPNQQLRQKLIPYAQIYKLEELLDVVDQYQQKTKNRIFWEYIMIDELTDQPSLARELVQLLKGKNAHINLIPYNQNPAIDLKESKRDNILRFKQILED